MGGDDELAIAARPLPRVAREAIQAKLEERTPSPGVEASGVLARPAPVFVTLRIELALRGCIGSLEARTANLIEETMDRARAAAFEDPRFPPMTLPELPRTTIEVSILGSLEPISSHAELDPDRFGIEVADDMGRLAVLLPQIDGVDTVEEQIDVCREKAGIGTAAPLEIRRFAVVKVLEREA